MPEDIFDDAVVEPAKMLGEVAEDCLDAVGAPVTARIVRTAIVAPAVVTSVVMRHAVGWLFGDE